MYRKINDEHPRNERSCLALLVGCLMRMSSYTITHRLRPPISRLMPVLLVLGDRVLSCYGLFGGSIITRCGRRYVHSPDGRSCQSLNRLFFAIIPNSTGRRTVYVHHTHLSTEQHRISHISQSRNNLDWTSMRWKARDPYGELSEKCLYCTVHRTSGPSVACQRRSRRAIFHSPLSIPWSSPGSGFRATKMP